jgi:hypothetical protein
MLHILDLDSWRQCCVMFLVMTVLVCICQIVPEGQHVILLVRYVLMFAGISQHTYSRHFTVT